MTISGDSMQSLFIPLYSKRIFIQIHNPQNKKIRIFTGYFADQPGALERAERLKNKFEEKLEHEKNYIKF